MSGESGIGFVRVGRENRMSNGMQWELDVFNKKLKADPVIPGSNIWEWIADVDRKGCLSFLPTIFKCCGFPLLARNVSILMSNYHMSGAVRFWNANN